MTAAARAPLLALALAAAGLAIGVRTPYSTPQFVDVFLAALLVSAGVALALPAAVRRVRPTIAYAAVAVGATGWAGAIATRAGADVDAHLAAVVAVGAAIGVAWVGCARALSSQGAWSQP